MLRTSITHPLRIDEVSVPGGGVLGLSICPGKQQTGAMTGSWSRDLATDLDAIARWGAHTFITLLEPQEMRVLGVPQLGRKVLERGWAWLHLPLSNDGVPNQQFLKLWQELREPVHASLLAGGRVFIHCMGGIGRTSTLAGMILTERGQAPDVAIAAICAARDNSFCVPEQVAFMHCYPQLMGSESRERNNQPVQLYRAAP